MPLTCKVNTLKAKIMSNHVELGACQAILSSIKTRVDQSVTVSLEINPNDSELINRLMRSYLEGDRLLTVAFVKEVE